MKILVTNNTLGGLGGSETYAYTLIKELHGRDDIEVHAFSPQIGLIGSKLKNIGVNVVNKPDSSYDLILASHTSTIPYIKSIKGFKVQTCHGVYPALEQPYGGLDGYVSISNEVYNHLKNKRIDSTIIHNGIDCERFKITHPINKELKSVLSLSHSDLLNNMLRSVCVKHGVKLICLNKYTNPIFNVEDAINEVDMVVTLGRGAYESMACGRNVMILDKRPYINKPPIGDGILTELNIENSLKNNCSGRFSNRVFGEKEIEEEIIKYDYTLGEFNREYALKNLNIKMQVDKYLNLKK